VVKAPELCGSGCLSKTVDLKKSWKLFCFGLSEVGAKLLVKAFDACRRQQMFWLGAKVTCSCDLGFEGGVLCVKN
jgi:hypothetical protein